MKLTGKIVKIIGLISFNAMAYTQQFPDLPDTLNGWKLTEQKRIDSHEALYDHIDGGAELYISYGFRSAISCRYTREGQPDVTAEVFDMGCASDAFGVYSQTRDKEEKEYGQGSYYVNGALFFWKGRYWISLITSETTEESEHLLRSLAVYIDEKLQETGESPVMISYLPAEDLVPGGYLYFHHYIWLNSYYFIATENILNIDENTPAVLAKYGPPDERLYLLMIQYPDSAKAEHAYTSFGKNYFPEGLIENCNRLDDNTWMAAGMCGNLLVGVFSGKSKEKTQELLGKVRNKLK
jgi:hypothetical protein